MAPKPPLPKHLQPPSLQEIVARMNEKIDKGETPSNKDVKVELIAEKNSNYGNKLIANYEKQIQKIETKRDNDEPISQKELLLERKSKKWVERINDLLVDNTLLTDKVMSNTTKKINKEIHNENINLNIARITKIKYENNLQKIDKKRENDENITDADIELETMSKKWIQKIDTAIGNNIKLTPSVIQEMREDIEGIANRPPKKVKISWVDVFIYSLLPWGQLFARIKFLNGSLDKWYLLFLQIPPISFIPMIMMKYGVIKAGKTQNPIDYAIILPVIAKLTFPILLPLLIDEEDSPFSFQTILTILYIVVLFGVNMYRRHKTCKSITIKSPGKALIDSIIMDGISRILPFIMDYLPGIGSILSIFKTMPAVEPVMDNIMSAMSVAAGYILVNIINQGSINKFCSTPQLGRPQDKVAFIGGGIIILVFTLLKAFEATGLVDDMTSKMENIIKNNQANMQSAIKLSNDF
jgi:hypothetical protein